MARLGLDCKIFLNEATYATPTWAEIDNVRDVSTTLEKGEADASSRSSGGFKEYLDALIDSGIDVEIIYENGNADLATLRTAFLARTLVDVAAMDQDIATSGAEGLRMQAKVMSFSSPEPLEDVKIVTVNFRPTPNSDSPPEIEVTA